MNPKWASYLTPSIYNGSFMGRTDLAFFSVLRNSFLFVGLAAGLAYGQASPELPPREVSICDLVRNPSPYDGQRIRVHGEANRDFEDFSLQVTSCGAQARRVWLQYGDQKTDAGAEVGHRFIQAAALIKNGDYDQFAQKIRLQRLLLPDLRPCSGPPCHYYRVTAAFTGRFFAGAEPGRASGQKTFVGFGHADCCHLLVVEQVSDVASERTQAPVGGQFQCSTEAWTPTVEQAILLASDPNHVFATIAKHWGDDGSQGTSNGNGAWITPDLLTSYTVDTLVSADKKAPDPKTTVTRESCHAVPAFAPRSVSEPVACETRDWHWQEDQQAAKDLQQTVTMGHDPWRLELRAASRNAVDDAYKQWGLLPAGAQLLDRCGNPTVFEDGQSAECGWSSPDGMQMLLVHLEKFDYLKRFGGHWEHVMWVATQVQGSFCHTPGEQEK